MATKNAAAVVAPARDDSASTTSKNALMSLLNPLLVQLRVPREIPAQNESKWTPNVAWKRMRSDTSDAEDDDEDGHTSDSSSTVPHATTSPQPRTNGASKQPHKRQFTAVESPEKSKKTRKPTYAVRKEEKETLLHELRVLEARAELLREQVGMPSLNERLTLEKAQAENKVLVDARLTHLQSLLGMHSVLSRNLRDQLDSSMRLKIRLGRDMAQRRATLLAMRQDRLNVAVRYLDERLRGVDISRPFAESTSWTSEQGDFWFQRADISHFEGVQSVKQVYDALMFYMVNMEISISEQLGQLTLREDIDSIDSKISNHRIISSTDHGVVLEMNSVNHAEYYESCPERDSPEHAIFTCDTVDEDELYPFCPDERVRKTITASISISLVRRPRTPKVRGVSQQGDDKGEFMVAMRRCAYLCIYKPKFEITPAALADMKANVAIWGDVMCKTVRETVYANAPVAPPAKVPSAMAS